MLFSVPVHRVVKQHQNSRRLRQDWQPDKRSVGIFSAVDIILQQELERIL